MTTIHWPRKPWWMIRPDDRTALVSIPFTWTLPGVRERLSRGSLLWDRAIVGGPAVDLIPGYFADMPYVTEGRSLVGALQLVNPMATRTTIGCPNKCRFCGIGQGLIEPGSFRELAEWPDLPILVDNNLFAASEAHFDRVMDRLERWGWCDFNQGVDCRLLNSHHAERIARVKRPVVRLALDSIAHADSWETAFGRLRSAGVAKNSIRSYALIGFKTGPDEAWARCRWIEGHGVKALPMWFHSLTAMESNVVTPEQSALGWTDAERMRIMQWFYQHRDRNVRVKGKAA